MRWLYWGVATSKGEWFQELSLRKQEPLQNNRWAEQKENENGGGEKEGCGPNLDRGIAWKKECLQMAENQKGIVRMTLVKKG